MAHPLLPPALRQRSPPSRSRRRRVRRSRRPGRSESRARAASVPRAAGDSSRAGPWSLRAPGRPPARGAQPGGPPAPPRARPGDLPEALAEDALRRRPRADALGDEELVGQLDAADDLRLASEPLALATVLDPLDREALSPRNVSTSSRAKTLKYARMSSKPRLEEHVGKLPRPRVRSPKLDRIDEQPARRARHRLERLRKSGEVQERAERDDGVVALVARQPLDRERAQARLRQPVAARAYARPISIVRSLVVDAVVLDAEGAKRAPEMSRAAADVEDARARLEPRSPEDLPAWRDGVHLRRRARGACDRRARRSSFECCPDRARLGRIGLGRRRRKSAPGRRPADHDGTADSPRSVDAATPSSFPSSLRRRPAPRRRIDAHDVRPRTCSTSLAASNSEPGNRLEDRLARADVDVAVDHGRLELETTAAAATSRKPRIASTGPRTAREPSGWRAATSATSAPEGVDAVGDVARSRDRSTRGWPAAPQPPARTPRRRPTGQLVDP